MRLGLSSARTRDSNPTASNLQHTTNTGTTQTQPHQISNTQRTENKTTDVLIQQHSRKLVVMDILISETCWLHKKWNKIASDIKLVFYSTQILKLNLKHAVRMWKWIKRQVLVSSVNRPSGLTKNRKFPGRLTVPCLREVVADLSVWRRELIQCQSVWYLRWTKRHWDGIFSEYFSFILSVSFRQCDMFAIYSSAIGAI